MSEVLMSEKGVELPPTELPSQKVLDKGLHRDAGDNALKAASTKVIDDPELAVHLDKIGGDLHDIADAGVKPLDHIAPKDSYVAEAVHDTASLLNTPGQQERSIIHSDFQSEVVHTDAGQTVTRQLSPDDPKLLEKVEVLESVLGAGERHEVPTDEKDVKIQEASTNIDDIKLREVTDKEGKVKMSVVKTPIRRYMVPPVKR